MRIYPDPIIAVEPRTVVCTNAHGAVRFGHIGNSLKPIGLERYYERTPRRWVDALNNTYLPPGPVL